MPSILLLNGMAALMAVSGVCTFLALTIASLKATYGRYSEESALAKVFLRKRIIQLNYLLHFSIAFQHN
jgi:hypothetical protein